MLFLVLFIALFARKIPRLCLRCALPCPLSMIITAFTKNTLGESMSEKLEKMFAIKKAGANCAQAVACAFCEDYGVSEADMMRMSATMGAGMCVGEVCGAAVGGMIILGLKYGSVDASDKESKKICKQKGREYMQRFRDTFGMVRCQNLLGHDINTPEGMELAKDTKKTRCRETLTTAVKLLEEFGC